MMLRIFEELGGDTASSKRSSKWIGWYLNSTIYFSQKSPTLRALMHVRSAISIALKIA